MSAKSYDLKNQPVQLQGGQMPRKRKKPRPCIDNIRDFMSGTSLHGFRYLMEEDLNWVER